MIAVADSYDVEAITTQRRTRELQWKSGTGAFPITEGFRYEFCQAKYSGGDVDLALVEALKRIDPTFEIVYDKWTAPGGEDAIAPGFHLYRVCQSGTTPMMDKMKLEVSIQSYLRDHDCNMVWPYGKPCLPGPWLIHRVLQHYVGGMDGKHNTTRTETLRKARDEERERRANVVRNDIETHNAIVGEYKDYLPSEFGGKGKTLRRTGLKAV